MSVAANNPVTHSDPSGLHVCLDSVCGGATGSGSVGNIVTTQQTSTYVSLWNQSLNQAVNSCGSNARCGQTVIRNYFNPNYANFGIGQYATQQTASLVASEQPAAQSSGGLWNRVSAIANVVALGASVLALATSFIPVLDLGTGALAGIADGVAFGASLFADAANSVAAGVNLYNGGVDFSQDKWRAGFIDVGSAALSGLGVGTSLRALSAAGKVGEAADAGVAATRALPGFQGFRGAGGDMRPSTAALIRRVVSMSPAVNSASNAVYGAQEADYLMSLGNLWYFGASTALQPNDDSP